MRRKKRNPCIFAVSDGQGVTCARVLEAAVLQFAGLAYDVVPHRNVRTGRGVESIVRKAARRHAVIFYTLVGHATRNAMQATAAELKVATVDILGPALAALHDVFRRTPDARPGLLHVSEKERFDRYDAIDYTLKHDDGARTDELKDADVVLVGVSRAAKTSTCFYLAYWGVKAANVPILPDVDPPAEVLALPRERVIGLRVNLSRLITVREARASHVDRGAMRGYFDYRAVTREITRANRTMDRQGWRSIDASYMAVEEIGHEVMRMRGLRPAD